MKRCMARGSLVALLALVPTHATAVARIDHEAETTYRQLSWADFRGPVLRGQQVAWLSSMIRLGSREVAVEEEGGVVRVRLRYPAAFAVMNKLASGFVPGGRDDDTLRHEQTHFDITEIHARRLALELPDLVAERSDGSLDLAIRDLDRAVEEAYLEASGDLERMQASYDGETGHGLRKREQKRWNREVGEMLASIEAYPLR